MIKLSSITVYNLFFITLLSLFFSEFSVGEHTTESGNLFHSGITLNDKKWFLNSFLHDFIFNFMEFPLM
jgi:hypothetical protein